MENAISKVNSGKYPSNQRWFIRSDAKHNSGWPDDSCVFGIAYHKDPFPSIDSIPSDISSFYSYFAEGNYEILEHLIEIGINKRLEHLTLGFEHDNSKYGFKDYSKISKVLSTAKFPKLKSFEYGIDLLLVNEEQYYPHLGDLSDVLNNMPNLEKLELSGSFELKNINCLKTVKNFFVMDSFADSSNGVISARTFDFLMRSDFEALEDFQIVLESNNNIDYYFKEDFLLQNIDRLKCVAIEGKFVKGTKEKLFNILNTRVEKLFLEGIIEE